MAEDTSVVSVVQVSCGSSHTCALLGEYLRRDLEEWRVAAVADPASPCSLSERYAGMFSCRRMHLVYYSILKTTRTTFELANGQQLVNAVPLPPCCCCPPCHYSLPTTLADCNVVATWGRGEDGQLGHGDAEQCVEPKAVAALVDQDIDSICCGAEYTVAVSRKHQRVYSWGW